MIFDVIVGKPVRGSGLGKELVEYVLGMDILKEVKSFELYCPDRISGFYESMGFSKSNSNLMTLSKNSQKEPS